MKKRNKTLRQLNKIENEIRKIVTMPENIVPFLVPGRLIKVKSDENDWGWGIVVNFTKMKINPKSIEIGKQAREMLQDISSSHESHYVIDVYLYVKNRLTSDSVL